MPEREAGIRDSGDRASEQGRKNFKTVKVLTDGGRKGVVFYIM